MPGWRNGRRRGLKPLGPQGRTGSTPVLGTMKQTIDILPHLKPDRFYTVMEVARIMWGPDAWDKRGSTRNALYKLEQEGHLVRNKVRPMGFKKR